MSVYPSSMSLNVVNYGGGMPIIQRRTTMQLTIKIEFDVGPKNAMSDAAIADQIVEAARDAAPAFAKVNDVFAMRNIDLKWEAEK
jgi:hypothetical protein